jgi:hypothetical protein
MIIVGIAYLVVGTIIAGLASPPWNEVSIPGLLVVIFLWPLVAIAGLVASIAKKFHG